MAGVPLCTGNAFEDRYGVKLALVKAEGKLAVPDIALRA